MKTTLLLVGFFICTSLHAFAQSGDERAIRELLETQRKAWNKGDIELFMQGYWRSDSLMFIGKSGVTYGWENTLKNYKRGYPDTAAMGKLRFDVLQVRRLAGDYYFVTGKWQLTIVSGNQAGHFTLLFRKINDQWLIVADHSS